MCAFRWATTKDLFGYLIVPVLAKIPTIEGKWGVKEFGLSNPNNVQPDNLAISKKRLVGLEWSCEVLSVISGIRAWKLKAKCSEAGGYEFAPVPISEVKIVLRHSRFNR